MFDGADSKLSNSLGCLSEWISRLLVVCIKHVRVEDNFCCLETLLMADFDNFSRWEFIRPLFLVQNVVTRVVS